jgi:hypothetical protein
VVIRSLADLAAAHGRVARPGTRVLSAGTYLVLAETDDGVVHLAHLVVGTTHSITLFFECRQLLVDGDLALPHLRGPNEDVSCMSCVAKSAS